MARKRPSSELEAPALPRYEAIKRNKLSPTVDAHSNSSLPSTCSVSEASALQSSPEGSDRTAQSSRSSLLPDGDDHFSSGLSSSSSSSDASDPQTESDEEITTIRATKKPDIGHLPVGEAPIDLKARLSAFLPQLAEANNALATGQSMEDVGEDDPHIEMNLGLGVLQERQEGDESSSSSSSSNDETSDSEDVEADGGAADVPLSFGDVGRGRRGEGVNVMHKLLGLKERRGKVRIKDVG